MGEKVDERDEGMRRMKCVATVYQLSKDKINYLQDRNNALKVIRNHHDDDHDNDDDDDHDNDDDNDDNHDDHDDHDGDHGCLKNGDILWRATRCYLHTTT